MKNPEERNAILFSQLEFIYSMAEPLHCISELVRFFSLCAKFVMSWAFLLQDFIQKVPNKCYKINWIMLLEYIPGEKEYGMGKLYFIQAFWYFGLNENRAVYMKGSLKLCLSWYPLKLEEEIKEQSDARLWSANCHKISKRNHISNVTLQTFFFYL